jgi:hypothetical protein
MNRRVLASILPRLSYGALGTLWLMIIKDLLMLPDT